MCSLPGGCDRRLARSKDPNPSGIARGGSMGTLARKSVGWGSIRHAGHGPRGGARKPRKQLKLCCNLVWYDIILHYIIL